MISFKKESYLLLYSTLACSIMLICVSVSSYLWRGRMTQAECYPTKLKYNYPFLSFMPSIDSSYNTAKFYSFIVKYIELTKNKNIEQFRRGLTEKTKNSATSEALLSAITYAKNEEKTKNWGLYFKSQDIFSRLNKSNLSWRFNIEGIEYVQTILAGKVTIVSVIGEYQVDSNNGNSNDNASDLWGYRRLVYKVIQGAPLKDKKGRWFNQDGFYVVDSFEEIIGQEEYDSLIDGQFGIDFREEEKK